MKTKKPINNYKAIFDLKESTTVDISKTFRVNKTSILNNDLFYYINRSFINKYIKSSGKLESGVKYEIEIYEIMKEINSEVILEFMRQSKFLFLDIVDIITIMDINKEIFPIEHWTLQFSDKKLLHLDSNSQHMIPGIYRRTENEFALSLISSFEEGISLASCPISILCVSKF